MNIKFLLKTAEDSTELSKYADDVLKEMEALKFGEFYEAHDILQTSGFWEWVFQSVLLALDCKMPAKDLAEKLVSSATKVVENPDEDLKKAHEAKKNQKELFRAYRKQLTNKLTELGFGEFYNNNHFLHRENFKEFMINQIQSAYDMRIPPEQAAIILYKEITTELSAEKFMSDLNFGDLKH